MCAQRDCYKCFAETFQRCLHRACSCSSCKHYKLRSNCFRSARSEKVNSWCRTCISSGLLASNIAGGWRTNCDLFQVMLYITLFSMSQCFACWM